MHIKYKILITIMAMAIIYWMISSIKVVYAYQAPIIKLPNYLEVVNPIMATPEMKVRAEFKNDPIMIEIAKAESRICDPDWKVNPTSSARGCFQILVGTWAAYGCVGDRMDDDDNIACARIIYDIDGTTPWNASKHVWGVIK